jgi:predicted DNA-binding transcriptional regulator YafY
MPRNAVGSQLKRLLGVLDALPQRGRGITCRQLFDAQPWGVDIRTLQRDLLALEELDLADRRSPSKEDLHDSVSERWGRVSGNDPRRVRLSTEQAIALGLLERLSLSLLPNQVVQALQPQFDEARRHLTAQRNVDPRTRWTDKVEVVPDTFTRKPVDVKPGVLKSLQAALLGNRQASARYRARARGLGTRRTLEPRALVQLGPTLFVIATRPDKPDYVPGWYAVHRFVSVRVLEVRCVERGFRLGEYLSNGGAEFGASGAPIAFKAWVCRDLKRTLLEAPLSKDMKIRADKGGAIVTATVRRSWPFQRWLLSRGPDIKVMEPPELRDYMVSTLRHACDAYA